MPKAISPLRFKLKTVLLLTTIALYRSAIFSIIVVQIIAALGVVVSVVYLAVQIHQQNEITKAQFGHSLTQRVYERYFATTKDAEFSEFLSKDWSRDDLTDTEQWRVTMFIITLLVDIFDVYEKVKKGFVDEKHLVMRMNALKFGTMKTDLARSVWDYWKLSRDEDFIKWFESEVFDSNDTMVDKDIVSSGLKSSLR